MGTSRRTQKSRSNCSFYSVLWETCSVGLGQGIPGQAVAHVHPADYPDYSPGPGAVPDEWREDLLILDEDLLPDWRAESFFSLEWVLAAADEVHRGEVAGSFHVDGGWRVVFQPDEPVNPEAYTALRFAFHPGDVTLPLINPGFRVFVNHELPVSLLENRLDVTRKEWQLVEIASVEFGLRQGIETIEL